jgi:regulator of PEP synthase PpsR (kinase-PPPase family)
MTRRGRSKADRPVVLVVSDGTGVTGERVVQAALTQFDPFAVKVERVQDVRDPEKIVETIEMAARRRATILYSLVSPEHRRVLLHEARRHHVVTIDLLGPILHRLSEVLRAAPRSRPGVFHQLDDEYFSRIEAIDFAVRHDDGRRVNDLDTADLVLVGVSRTSKTPISMYLAYRGWHVANIPIVAGIEPPAALYGVSTAKVVALAARPEWLEDIRTARERRMTGGVSISYSDLSHIKEELAWFHTIVGRGGWPIVDVTHKAIEETAAEIVILVRE